jgi:hypothetical protein
VPDEFPTLEAALAVSIVVLAWRLWLLLRALRRVAAGGAQRISDPGRGGDKERSRRRAARPRGRAGTDLVIAAVLGGALLYAQQANFDVRFTFYLLGAIALLLLLVSAVVHSRIARARAEAPGQGPATGTEAELGHPQRGGGSICPDCGASRLRALSASDELGAKLAALGVKASSLCTKCGHLEGRTRTGTW